MTFPFREMQEKERVLEYRVSRGVVTKDGGEKVKGRQRVIYYTVNNSALTSVNPEAMKAASEKKVSCQDLPYWCTDLVPFCVCVWLLSRSCHTRTQVNDTSTIVQNLVFHQVPATPPSCSFLLTALLSVQSCPLIQASKSILIQQGYSSSRWQRPLHKSFYHHLRHLID